MTPNPTPAEPGRWTHGVLPANVRVGRNTVITGEFAFKRLHSRCDPAVSVGAHCTMDGVHFAVGREGRVEVTHACR